MLSDLPKVTVGVARLFDWSQGKDGQNCPADLSYLRLPSPMQRMSSPDTKKGLKYFSRAYAPLTKHPDAHRIYNLRCNHVQYIGDAFDQRGWRCRDWQVPCNMLYMMVRHEMPGLDGGVGKEKWWAYVRCVIKALSVWQAYCEHVKELSARQLECVQVDSVRAEEGVMAYSVGW